MISTVQFICNITIWEIPRDSYNSKSDTFNNQLLEYSYFNIIISLLITNFATHRNKGSLLRQFKARHTALTLHRGG